METEGKIGVTRAPGVGGMGSSLMGMEFHFGMMRKFWRWMMQMVA